MGSSNRTAIRRTIESIVLISVFFLASIHSFSMAKPQLIKIDKGTKSHQHHVAHKTYSKAKPKKSSNTHNTHHSNHSQHAPHPQHSKTAPSKSGSKHSRPKNNQKRWQNISQRRNTQEPNQLQHLRQGIREPLVITRIE